MSKDTPCPLCGGHGRIEDANQDDDPVWVRCPGCNGEGYVTEVATKKQPLPKKSERSQYVYGLATERAQRMLLERTEIGIKQYGAPLATFIGRNARRDLLEELIDGFQYAVQIDTEWNYGIRLMNRTVEMLQPVLDQLETSGDFNAMMLLSTGDVRQLLQELVGFIEETRSNDQGA